MDIISTILSAAKLAKVSGILLTAICSHESGGFTMSYSAYDKGSPSYGVCQIKEASARQLGFKGRTSELMNSKINIKYAALYLKYEQDRYGKNDWVVLVSAYNAGTFKPSNKVKGCPKNFKYVRLVQKKLPEDFQDRLECGRELAEEDEK